VKIRICDEWESGLGWIAPEPAFLERASHALACEGRVWLVDPIDGQGVEEGVRRLGEPAGVIQLLDRHERDGPALAERLRVPLHRVPDIELAGSPFVVVPVVRLPGWREVALWWPDERVLACADVLGTAAYYRGPGERLAVHPLLRLAPARRLATLRPEHVLCGHGEGIHGPEAALALEEALATARRNAPRWLWHQLRRRR
jgi:hypothetical protein